MKREFNFHNIDVEVGDKEVKYVSKKATNGERRMLGSMVTHIKHIMAGVMEDYVYKLEVCNVHFPMTVSVEGDKMKIKNFFGEKVDRSSKISDNVDVKVNGSEIVVSSFDKEAAGQTAANMEKATKITNRDRRIFQDGIFITEKPGRNI